jgi:hypothetical protein
MNGGGVWHVSGCPAMLSLLITGSHEHENFDAINISLYSDTNPNSFHG